MRLFIASPVTLHDYAAIRRSFADVVRGKWVEEENLHLTWHFPGEVAASEVEGILARLAGIAPLAHTVVLRGLGSFGRPPRVLYAAASDLLLRRKAVDFEAAGWEMARFHPHMTLCRIKAISERKRFREIVSSYRGSIVGTIAPEIHLYRSIRTEEGPRYSRIDSVRDIESYAKIDQKERIRMQIQVQPMGPYQTNCYIVTIEGKDLIIDPGVGATEWVLRNVKNPVAILNTHGHFDHVWSNAELKEKLHIPIYAPKGDLLMLESDPLGQGTPPSHADYAVEGDEVLEIEGVRIRYRHFPGHTPGCSVIEIGDNWFSGDFLFRQSIGRWDFPASSGADMLKSLEKAQQIKEDYTIYPGHGPHTTLAAEQRVMPYWIEQVRRTL